MKFKVEGTFKDGTKIRNFEKVVDAKSESHAKDITYSLFGSKNRVKRSMLKINKIEKIGE